MPGYQENDYLDEDGFWRQVELARERAQGLVARMRDGDVRHDPKGLVPRLVRALVDVPGAPIVRAPFNIEQRAAIDARGTVFVSAGAGTGKTAVLVERFAEAVCEAGVDVDSILVITYTERAAGELRARIRARLVELGRPELARRLDGAWISTIHGLCLRLLRGHPFAAGLDPRFRVLDESQARLLRTEAFTEALAAFVAGGGDRVDLLSLYGAQGLRRMLTGVYETLRAAGRARPRARRPTAARHACGGVARRGPLPRR